MDHREFRMEQQEVGLDAPNGWTIMVKAGSEEFWITADPPTWRAPLVGSDKDDVAGMYANKRNVQAMVEEMRRRIRKIEDGLRDLGPILDGLR
ncbi:MAG: hypothetical protein V3T54_00325 [Acidobacteriota bacterium]